MVVREIISAHAPVGASATNNLSVVSRRHSYEKKIVI
jgi:hypothetical protein